MEPFKKESGTAAPYLAANVDTDVIMPKQFLKRINRDGLAEGVLFDQRFLPNGQPNPEFILNKPDWNDAKFLVVGDNFGCGSSREYAVWGIQQLGIKAIIGTSFAGIFYDNCQRNGVLLITLSPEQRDQLGELVANPEKKNIDIDLPNQSIYFNEGDVINFDIEPIRKESLIKGLDTISTTLEQRHLIEKFEETHFASNPWLTD